MFLVLWCKRALGEKAAGRAMRRAMRNPPRFFRSKEEQQRWWAEFEAKREAERKRHQEQMEFLHRRAEAWRRQRIRFEQQEYHNQERERIRRASASWSKRRTEYGPGDEYSFVGPTTRGYLQQLQLPENKIPTEDEVKEAFRKMAMKYHPDRLDKSDPNFEKKAQRFNEISTAYNALLKDIKKYE